MDALADGTYDVIVVDAQTRGANTIAIDVAVSSGAHRGEVVRVLATGLDRSEIDLLATPATLVVVDGQPTLQF